MKPLLRLCLAVCLLACFAFAADEPKPTPKTYDELRAEIEKVLRETNTPGVSIAIVRPGEPDWLAGIGRADVAAGKDVTPETLFRIGSVSKMFVGLAALQLQEQGKLDLEAPLRSLAPEVEFRNAWEEKEPVRLVHLLEHTAGFDDLTFREYLHSDPTPVTLKAGLEFEPRSRYARWQPGTRFSYANSGAAIAAYVVEKTTGKTFEEYARENFFVPLRMDTAGYLLTPEAEARLTRLYRDDGKTPYPYWHIIMRPAGAINASATDMSRLLHFFLGRGTFEGRTLVQAAAIDRMERPQTTYAARKGLPSGYGVNNYWSFGEGLALHGHNGGVQGGLTEFAYIPDRQAGYFFSINSGSVTAFQKISGLIQRFLTHHLGKPEPKPAAPLDQGAVGPYLAFWEPISPRQEILRGVERILGLTRARLEGETLVVRPLAGETRRFVHTGGQMFRRDENPEPSLILLETPEGRLVQTGMMTARVIPAWYGWLEVVLTAVVLLLMASALLFALVWVPRWIFSARYRERVPGCVPLMPLLAVLSLAAATVIFLAGSGEFLENFGRPTWWAYSFYAARLAFAVLALLALVATLRGLRRTPARLTAWHSFLVALACTGAAVYLLYWGLLTFRTWT